MAIHALTTGARMRAPILPTVLAQFEATAGVAATPLALSAADRAWLSDMIDTMVAILDHADGDADMEADDLDRCLAGDDGCGPIAAPELDALWSDAA